METVQPVHAWKNGRKTLMMMMMMISVVDLVEFTLPFTNRRVLFDSCFTS